ncbi:MAG: amidohydrolase family protein [Acidimicrobiales bacterium]
MRKLFSVDDHIVEPPDVWSKRVPRRFLDEAPRIVDDGGSEYWLVEGVKMPTVGLNAVAGKPQEEWTHDPVRFSDMIPGCYDPKERARDMRQEGIVASVNFPTLPRFGGALFPTLKDKELADACVTGWNDFMVEEWCAEAPELFVPMAIVQLWDPALAVKEIERNLARGLRAISIPEETSILGLPSYYTDYWDPVWSLCQEAGIPVCMHIGSSGWRPYMPPEANPSLMVALGFVPTITHALGMMYGPVPRKFPDIKIVYSEGGINWVPSALERADRMYKRHQAWTGTDDVLPSEVCRKNMWFCLIEEPYGLRVRHEIGIDRILWECDYPHSSCVWPNTQQIVDELFAPLPDDEAEMIAFRTAEQVFNWKCSLPSSAKEPSHG